MVVAAPSAVLSVPGVGQVSVTSGSVTLDDGWAPYCQVQLTCPAIPELVPALDPRRPDARAHLFLSQSFTATGPVADTTAEWASGTVADITAEWASGTVADTTAAWGDPLNPGTPLLPRHRVMDLGLRSVRYDRATAQLQVGLATDEAVLMDHRNLDLVSWYPGTADLRSIVAAVLARIGASLTPGTATASVVIEATEWEPGRRAWEYLAPLVQASGLRLWCDTSRRWHLAHPDAPAADGTPELQLVKDRNLSGLVETIDRDRGRWHDAVVIRYRWTDPTDRTQRVEYDVATAGQGTLPLLLEYDRRYPGPGAAAAVLARMEGRGRDVQATAQADPTVEPGQPVTISTDTVAYLGRVAQVRLELGPERGDTMTVTPRGLVDSPPEAWARVPDTTTWASVPDATTWANYTAPTLEG